MTAVGRIRTILGVGVVLVAVLVGGTDRALATNGEGFVSCGQDGQAACVARAATSPSAAASPAPSAVSRTVPTTQQCRDPSGTPTPCYDSTYGWLGASGCYYKPSADPQQDQANLGDATTGRGPGGWYQVTCPGVPGTGGAVEWIAGAPPVDIPAVDPATLAQQAVSRFDLPRPTLGMSPTGVQVVRVPTWLWITTAAWATRTATAAVPGVTVTATATPARVVWTMGDGATVTCTGPGTPWTTGTAPTAASPTCGHTYLTDSTSASGGTFTVTATISWTVTWTDGAAGGTEPVMTTTAATAVRVLQVNGVITT